MNPNCKAQIRLYISNCIHDKFTWIFKGNLQFNLSKIELQLSLPKAGLSTSFPVLKNGNSNISSSSGKICTATPHIQNLSVLPPRRNKIPTTHSMMVQLVLNEQELGHWPVLLKFSPSLVLRGGWENRLEVRADHVGKQQAPLSWEARRQSLLPPPLISWNWVGKMGISNLLISRISVTTLKSVQVESSPSIFKPEWKLPPVFKNRSQGLGGFRPCTRCSNSQPIGCLAGQVNCTSLATRLPWIYQYWCHDYKGVSVWSHTMPPLFTFKATIPLLATISCWNDCCNSLESLLTPLPHLPPL